MSEISRSICARCVMDTTAPDIEFDEKGNCNFCNHYFKELVKEIFSNDDGKKRLERLFTKIKKENSRYDCLIGLSGGVDSSYVAYLVKNIYGLNPLAIHLDNGWNSELSVANVEQIVKRLNIDLYTHVLDWNEFKDIQISFLKSGISNIEIPTDHAIWAILIKKAAEMNIRYIIAGNNVVTESIMPESWLYGSKDSKIIKAIHKKYGKVKLKRYPSLSITNYVDYLLLRGMKWIPILNYVPYSKSEAKKVLINDLGWRDYGGKHYESIYTRFFHAYYLPKKFGIDLRKAYLSALVCSGQISRDEALNELSKPPATDDILIKDRDYVIKKLGLTFTEFEEIMNSNNRTYNDYPNNHNIWKKFGGIVRYARNRIIRIDN